MLQHRPLDAQRDLFGPVGLDEASFSPERLVQFRDVAEVDRGIFDGRDLGRVKGSLVRAHDRPCVPFVMRGERRSAASSRRVWCGRRQERLARLGRRLCDALRGSRDAYRGASEQGPRRCASRSGIRLRASRRWHGPWPRPIRNPSKVYLYFVATRERKSRRGEGARAIGKAQGRVRRGITTAQRARPLSARVAPPSGDSASGSRR